MLAAAAAQEDTILGQKTLSPQGSPDETPDELRSYLGIADDDTRHETVNHKAEVWVIGDVHTNSIEGVRSPSCAVLPP